MSKRNKNPTSLNIGFISTRFAGTDGVSLEALKWEKVFASFGHRSYWLAGQLDKPSDVSMEVPEAFFNHPENLELNKRLYGIQHRSREVTDILNQRKEYLKDKVYSFIADFNLDLLLVENALAIPMHVPLGMALTEVIAETEIPTIGHHHDCWWERPRFLLNAIQDVLSMAFPPDLPSVRHVVINSMIQRELAARRGVVSTVIYNVVDFDAKTEPAMSDAEFRKDFGFAEDDILILQPTRIVSRKGIEQALQLVSRLNMANVKLLISHAQGDEGDEYYQWITETARQLGIDVNFLYNRLAESKTGGEDGKGKYTLWDVYPHVDLVTYPSLYEGFGNALLESIYYKKPLLVNRYSVYIVDIEPKGFDMITIDGYLTQKAVQQVREILTDSSRRAEMVEKNYEIARRFFSLKVLKRRLSSVLANFYGYL